MTAFKRGNLCIGMAMTGMTLWHGCCTLCNLCAGMVLAGGECGMVLAMCSNRARGEK